MKIRKIFFWMHLAAGCLAGIVILMMCVTGIMLAWKRQVLEWSDRGFRHAPAQVRMAPEALLAKVAAARHASPTSLVLRSDPAAPATVEFGRDASVYVNPETGEMLGEGSRTLRAFFRGAEDWHRWLAVSAESRSTARGVTGACNLAFLGLLLSGFYLWLPKKWNRQNLRPAIWFRRGKNGRARDWNWHNTIGIWCLAPLLVIVITGVVMSYPWANNLVYRMTGSEMPKQGGGRAAGGEREAMNVSFAGLDSLWAKAENYTPGWKTITMRIPGSVKAPATFQIDSGDGGRPDLKGQLTLNRATGDVVRWEPFRSNSPGRQLRSWIRFSHTGEAAGVFGETVAAVASLGGVILVWTGISLAIRRLARSRAKAVLPNRASQAA